jgi:1,4-dihydroxy-2-naphthoate octaprenyltransferase
MAAADQPLAWGWLALTVLGVCCGEVAKNASGEIVDVDSGTDLAITDGERSPFSGGKQVLVDSLLTRRQTWAIAAVFFLAAIMIGLVIAMLRDSRVLTLGAMGVGLAWYYHGGTIRLSYRGLGELAVALAYGPLVVCGTYLVQTGDVSAPLLHTSMALGLLVAAFLWINEFPDYRADKQAGKNNLVVRLGPQKATLCYVTIIATGYTWLVLAAINFPGGTGLLGGLAGALPAAFSAWQLLNNTGDTSGLIPAQAASLASFVLMACGAGLGYLLV